MLWWLLFFGWCKQTVLISTCCGQMFTWLPWICVSLGFDVLCERNALLTLTHSQFAIHMLAIGLGIVFVVFFYYVSDFYVCNGWISTCSKLFLYLVVLQWNYVRMHGIWWVWWVMHSVDVGTFSTCLTLVCYLIKHCICVLFACLGLVESGWRKLTDCLVFCVPNAG